MHIWINLLIDEPTSTLCSDWLLIQPSSSAGKSPSGATPSNLWPTNNGDPCWPHVDHNLQGIYISSSKTLNICIRIQISSWQEIIFSNFWRNQGFFLYWHFLGRNSKIAHDFRTLASQLIVKQRQNLAFCPPRQKKSRNTAAIPQTSTVT